MTWYNNYQRGERMATVKTRKQGNSIMITIPATLGIEEGQEFFIIKKDNGAITMIPKVENPFLVAEDGAFYTPEENIDYIPAEGELEDV